MRRSTPGATQARFGGRTFSAGSRVGDAAYSRCRRRRAHAVTLGKQHLAICRVLLRRPKPPPCGAGTPLCGTLRVAVERNRAHESLRTGKNVVNTGNGDGGICIVRRFRVLVASFGEQSSREGTTYVARQEVVTLVDDLDGSAAEETIRFGLDGETYEIDLSRSNARKLRDALAPYINVARRVRGRGPAAGRRGRRKAAAAAPRKRAAAKKTTTRGRRTSRTTAASAADIRAWAKSKGIPVNERGRISAEVIEAYNAAH